MHNVKNKGHKWNSTSPAEHLLSHKYAHVRSSEVVCSLTPPHGGARIPPRTLSQVTCCSLTSAPINAGQELPPSQSLDANQSINNRDHARGSFLSRYWEQILVRAAQSLHTSVQEWRVALCTFAKNTPRPNSPDASHFTGQPCLWPGRRCAAPGLALSASSSSSCSSSPSPLALSSLQWEKEKEMKTCQKRLFLEERKH